MSSRFPIRLRALAGALLLTASGCGGSDPTPKITVPADAATIDASTGDDGGASAPDAAGTPDVIDAGYSPTACPLTAGHPKCPPAYVCSCPPLGSNVPVCAAAGAVSPPPCTQQSDCADIPGATCQPAPTGGGIYCILACSP